ncbi:MAG TPA: MXAN_6640 family putative metalloprotease, partial [Terriglobales bacterium]|nr:MXAN_6640 family putative metalloprotease [Terriglobales bacterium]
DSLGYTPPPSDGSYPPSWPNGGDGKFDIYLLDLGTSILGATFPETTLVPYPAWVWTSFIELDNDYTDYPALHPQYDWLRVTSAHEFFHAIQFGYDVFENEVVTSDVVHPYWMEMSATWMENEVYDYINDYIYYLPSFFNSPWTSLRNFTGLHPYGSVVWPMFLGERFGVNIIKDIWTACGQVPGDNVLSATDGILRNGTYNSSLNSAFQEFSIWNYFTGDRANPSLYGFYSEGPRWCVDYPTCHTPIRVVLTNQHTLYPATDIVNQLPEDLGATYINFSPPSDTGGFRIDFSGDKGPDWNFSLIGFRGTVIPPWDTVVLLASTPGSINGQGLVFASERFTEVPMIIARGDTISSQNYRYVDSTQFDPALNNGFIPPATDRVFQNFPNPFVIKEANSTTKFPIALEGTSDVKLFIFTSSGELVWKQAWSNLPAANYDITTFTDPSDLPFQWDGRNLNGEYVASGIYLYRIVTNGTSTTKKLVVVNER